MAVHRLVYLACAVLAACGTSQKSVPPAGQSAGGAGGAGADQAPSDTGGGGAADMSTAGASPSGTCELRGTPTPCCLAELWESCTGLGSCVQGRSMSFATYCFSNGVGLRWEPGPDDSVIGIASRDGNICYTFTTKDGEQTIRDAAGQTVAKVWNALDDYDAQCVGDERETYAYPSPPWHDSCVQGDCQPP